MGYGKEYDSDPNPCGCGEDDCPDCAPRRIAQLEAQLREREAECERVRTEYMALHKLGSERLSEMTTRAESAEQALAAAREENERMNSVREFETEAVGRQLAALKSRSEGRVERVARVIGEKRIQLCGCYSEEDVSEAVDSVARAVLEAADGEGE